MSYQPVDSLEHERNFESFIGLLNGFQAQGLISWHYIHNSMGGDRRIQINVGGSQITIAYNPTGYQCYFAADAEGIQSRLFTTRKVPSSSHVQSLFSGMQAESEWHRASGGIQHYTFDYGAESFEVMVQGNTACFTTRLIPTLQNFLRSLFLIFMAPATRGPPHLSPYFNAIDAADGPSKRSQPRDTRMSVFYRHFHGLH